MNILPFHLNIPAEIILERPEGTLVQGRYGDRVMFSLTDGRVMYVPPFVADKIQAEGVAAGERFELCKTQVRNGRRRSVEWIVRRLDPLEELAGKAEDVAAEASRVGNGSLDHASHAAASQSEPVTALERDLRASIESVAASDNSKVAGAAFIQVCLSREAARSSPRDRFTPRRTVRLFSSWRFRPG